MPIDEHHDLPHHHEVLSSPYRDSNIHHMHVMTPYHRIEESQYHGDLPLYSQVPSAKELKKQEKRLWKDQKREWKYDHKFGHDFTPSLPLTHPDLDYPYGPTLIDQSHDA